MGVGGRVGSMGVGAGYGGYYSGKSTTDFNEEIVWTCIGMAILIAILITMALIYIVYEKCSKKSREYFINALQSRISAGLHISPKNVDELPSWSEMRPLGVGRNLMATPEAVFEVTFMVFL